MFLVFNIDQTIGGKQFGRWNMGGAGVVGAAAAATTAAATTTTSTAAAAFRGRKRGIVVKISFTASY